ncbi:group I truncated hemoglobin [Magnetococcus sp. PR-3]|uniref:group I truncated hemoglobin n=1 Tax=Magnetococcus sp. PR-3 TaxID=3120355 RepID=UPI002FCE25ED
MNWMKIGTLSMLFSLMLGLGVVVDAQAEQAKSLYERLGGYDAIHAITHDLAGRLVKDEKLGRFWAHRGQDGINREVQLIVDFLANKSGGRHYYTGREMKLSHVGMGIDEEDWTRMMDHLKATLSKFKVATQARKDVIAFIKSTKQDMVEDNN